MKFLKVLSGVLSFIGFIVTAPLLIVGLILGLFSKLIGLVIDILVFPSGICLGVLSVLLGIENEKK